MTVVSGRLLGEGAKTRFLVSRLGLAETRCCVLIDRSCWFRRDISICGITVEIVLAGFDRVVMDGSGCEGRVIIHAKMAYVIPLIPVTIRRTVLI